MIPGMRMLYHWQCLTRRRLVSSLTRPGGSLASFLMCVCDVLCRSIRKIRFKHVHTTPSDFQFMRSEDEYTLIFVLSTAAPPG